MRRALAVIGVLSSGCYADSAWSLRVRDPRAVTVVRRALREDPLTWHLEGEDRVALPAGETDADALLTEDPRRGRVTVSRRAGVISLACARCEDERAWTLLRATRWTLSARDGHDPIVRGDPTVIAWHPDALADRHAAWAVGLVTPRANLEVIRLRETPSRGVGWALLAGAATALSFGVYGAAREEVFFLSVGLGAGGAMLATALWNLLAPARVTDFTP